ncbi:hypothetical protein GCM10027447_01390 [Glycomyces halotolerans]
MSTTSTENPATEACCSTEELSTCCAPEDKGSCCGTAAEATAEPVAAPSSCGCK